MPNADKMYKVNTGIVLQNSWARLKYDPLLGLLRRSEFKVSEELCFIRC
jgi:hypothetical protein